MKQIVKALIFNRERKMLLVRRTMLETWDPGLWSLPSGELKADEKLFEAIQREVKEEVGLNIEVPSEPRCSYLYPDNKPDKATAEVFLFITDKWQGDVTLNFEHTNFKWVAGDKAQRLRLAPSAKLALHYCIPYVRH
jgi:8-oxo-dGTP pyrophosphatase MutT (NUDIX family)